MLTNLELLKELEDSTQLTNSQNPLELKLLEEYVANYQDRVVTPIVEVLTNQKYRLHKCLI